MTWLDWLKDASSKACSKEYSGGVVGSKEKLKSKDILTAARLKGPLVTWLERTYSTMTHAMADDNDDDDDDDER